MLRNRDDLPISKVERLGANLLRTAPTQAIIL